MSGVFNRLILVLAAVSLFVSSAMADSLQLKNGSMIKGKYRGGTDTEVEFQVGSTVQHYAVADIEFLTFEQSAPVVKPNVRKETPELQPRPSQAVASTPAMRTPAANAVVVPSGTSIMVRTIDAVDSDTNQIGDKFQASLEQPIIIDDVVVVEKGADIYGRLVEATQAGHIQGRSQLRLELTSIVVNGQTYSLVTGEYALSGSSRGSSSAKRIGGGAAAGALLGAIIGGGKGAAVGAGVGAGAGTAVQVATKGEQVHVPSETLLEFTLQQDLRIPVSTTTNASR